MIDAVQSSRTGAHIGGRADAYQTSTQRCDPLPAWWHRYNEPRQQDLKKSNHLYAITTSGIPGRPCRRWFSRRDRWWSGCGGGSLQADSGRRDAEFGSDPLAGPSLVPQGFDPANDILRSRMTHLVRPGGSVPQTDDTFCTEACNPFYGGLRANAEGCGLSLRHLPVLQHAVHQHGSNMLRQSCILVSVHSVLLGAELLQNTSISTTC